MQMILHRKFVWGEQGSRISRYKWSDLEELFVIYEDLQKDHRKQYLISL